MKSLFLVCAFICPLSFGGTAAAQTKAAPAKTAEVEKSKKKDLSWADYKSELNSMASKLKDPKTSKDAKAALMPHANEVLSELQDLKLSGAQKTEQIRTVIEFLAASSETDFSNSNSNTLYYDYKENKKAYLSEIGKLKSKETKQDLIQAFKDWEDFEKNSDKDAESDNE